MRHAGVTALALSIAALTPAVARAAQNAVPTPPLAAAATQARDLSFTVPLVYNQKVLGDVLVQISANGDVDFDSQTLRAQLLPLLNDLGRERLDAALASSAFVNGSTLSAAGFDVRFDQNRLELVVERIDGNYRPIGSLGARANDDRGTPLPTVAPADFSAFLNINGNFDYDESGARSPEIYLFGASRYKNVVVELDGAFTDQLGEDYQFYRRSLRAIYDVPDKYQRFSAGDLRVDTVPLLRTPFIGGVSVERRRQTFNPFLPASRLGGREIFLDSRSTVDVLINGAQYQTLQLEPGRYDLSNLPLDFGSNDVRLLIRDAAGREQAIDYDYFFEPLDLEAGDYEYVFSVGAIARSLSFQPSYSDTIAAVGYYRKAFSESFVFGGGLQVSNNRQLFALETTLVPQVIPGSIDFQGAVSRGDGGLGTGYAFRGSYRWRGGNDYENRRQFALTVDYQSKDYGTLDEVFIPTVSTFNVTASYTQSFSLNTYGSAGLTYSRTGGASGNRTVAYAELTHRLNNRFLFTGGVEYGKDNFYRSNFGVRIGVSVLFGDRTRANVDYRSRTENLRASLSRGSDNNVGSWGYDIGFNDSRGDTAANASVNYVGNRFDARASVFSNGSDFGNIADRKRARLQIGTSLAFADGTFGIGRPINDSFAVSTPHSSLPDGEVITGRSLRNDSYEARSGTFGAAVQPNLSSYSRQNIQFDLADIDSAYDIGSGVARVDPPFHSGYKIVVGNNRYVSAVGNMTLGGKPLALATGRVTSPDDEGFEAQPFFTNSVGRFGIIGLAPGKTYVVTLNGTGKSLTIEIPDKNDGLYRMGTVDVPGQSE